jgi:hypothetical protein
LIHGHPDRIGPFLPLLYRELFWRMLDRILVLAWLHECDEIVRHSAAGFGAVLLQLLVEEANMLGAGHLRHGAFPDRPPGMHDPSCILVDADDVAREIPDPDRAVLPFGHREIGAMNGGDAARLRQAEFLPHHERIVVRELLIGGVAHIRGALRVDEERAERRGIDAEVNRLIRQLPEKIDAVRIVCGEAQPVGFVQAAQSHAGNLPE